jgi:hypothetical protein
MTHSINNKKVGAYWPRVIVDKIDEIAKRENRTRSNTMLTLIVQQLAARNENVGSVGTLGAQPVAPTSTNHIREEITTTPPTKQERDSIAR